MAFRKLLFNRVESDAGFRVKIRPIQGFVEYREESRIARLPVEPVMGRPLTYVYKDTEVVWNPPHSEEIISEEKRQQILTNIVAALKFCQYTVDFV